MNNLHAFLRKYEYLWPLLAVITYIAADIMLLAFRAEGWL